MDSPENHNTPVKKVVRKATPSDAELISKLVIEASLALKDTDFSVLGWALLKKTNTPEATLARLLDEKYFALICEIDGNAVGYISMFNFEKIDHLFVLPNYRKMSVAKSLWAKAEKICGESNNSPYYWVRSSSLAVPVYASFGFRVSGEKQSSNGISFQLMEKGRK